MLSLMERSLVLQSMFYSVPSFFHRVYIQINESKKWTDKEDELLRQAIAKYGENRWEDVAKDIFYSWSIAVMIL